MRRNSQGISTSFGTQTIVHATLPKGFHAAEGHQGSPGNTTLHVKYGIAVVG